MFERLEGMERRLAELELLLGDPSVVGDQKRFRALNQEYSSLLDPVKAWRRLQGLETQLGQARDLERQEADPDMRALAREEISDLEAQVSAAREDLRLQLIPKDPLDSKNIIMEIRAGTGGDEAGLFAADLYRMYCRYVERKGWKTEVISHSSGDLGGLKEMIFTISGKDVYSHLRWESGGHRVQRIPITEANGRIQTSAATVAVLPEAEESDVELHDKDLRIDVFRSSGPGGQSVNTTDSAVRVTHIPTGLVVSCQDEKSQIKNKTKALMILRSRILEAEQARIDAERSAARKEQVGSGDRSDRIRTYNFPQNRCTDHRINLTLYNLDRVMDGDLEEIVQALRVSAQQRLLTDLATS